MLTPEMRNRGFPSLQGMTYLNTAAEGSCGATVRVW